MVHQHYGTQTVNRGAVMPECWSNTKMVPRTASANLRGRLYLIAASSALIPVICSWKFFSTDAVTAWITNPFPVFLISPAFSGRYFHSHFQEFSHETLITFRIVLRLRAGRSLPADRPWREKRQNWQTTWKRPAPAPVWIAMHRSFATPRGQQKAITVRLMTMLSFRSAWQNTSGTWLKPLLTTMLILIQRYKRMSTALATLAGKLAERVGMDSVDPQELITTLRQTAFKGDASGMRSSSHCWSSPTSTALIRGRKKFTPSW